MEELFQKYDILHDKLLSRGRIFQAHYVDVCKRTIGLTADYKNDGRKELVKILVDLIKKRPHGFEDAMNVVAACLALFQGVEENGKEGQH